MVLDCDPLYCDWPVLLLSWWNFGCGDVAKPAAETALDKIIHPKNINTKNKTSLHNLVLTLFIEVFLRFIISFHPLKGF